MSAREHGSDRFTSVGDQYADYEVYDRDGKKVGKVEALFLDQNDQPEYVGVKMGLMGFLGESSTLIPWEMCSVDEERQTIEVASDRETVKAVPSFDDDQQITPEFERQVYDHYGLSFAEGAEGRGAFGDYYFEEEELDVEARVAPGTSESDVESGEGSGDTEPREGVGKPSSDVEDEGELRVQRTEEELRAGTREREAGKVNVRKRVRTDREQVRVPKRREEVHVDRVPVEEGREVAESEIGDDELSMPVTEEEVVVEKRPVAKEEIRVRKDVVEDEEVVEEDVRREEVDIDDQSSSRRNH